MNKKIDLKDWITCKEAAPMLGASESHANKARYRKKFFDRREIKIDKFPRKNQWYAYLPHVKRAIKRWGSHADARTTAFDRAAEAVEAQG